MKIRPGRTRSLIGGILMLAVMAVGLFLMPGPGIVGGMPGMGGALSVFRILWIAIGLIGAGVSFYNAFSEKGVPLYEIETDGGQHPEGEAYCPKCGAPVGKDDRFCRKCGSPLS